jgi:hypothetical protein
LLLLLRQLGFLLGHNDDVDVEVVELLLAIGFERLDLREGRTVVVAVAVVAALAADEVYIDRRGRGRRVE